MADPKKEAARLLEKYFADLGAATKAARAARPGYPKGTGLHELDLPEGEPGLLFRGLAAEKGTTGHGARAAAEFYTADPSLAKSYSDPYPAYSSWNVDLEGDPISPYQGKRHTFPEDYRPRVKAVLHTPTNVLDLTGESEVPEWALDIIKKHDEDAPRNLRRARFVAEGVRDAAVLPSINLDELDRSKELFEEAKKRGHSTVKFRDYGRESVGGQGRRVSYVPLEDVETVGIYDTSEKWSLGPGRGHGEKLPESAKQLELPFDPNVNPNISDKLKRFLKKLPFLGTAVGAALIPGEVQAAYDRGGEVEAAKTLAVELARMGDPGVELLYELAAAVPDAASYIARLGASKRELQRPAGEKMY